MAETLAVDATKLEALVLKSGGHAKPDRLNLECVELIKRMAAVGRES